jgi:hypothetical protein
MAGPAPPPHRPYLAENRWRRLPPGRPRRGIVLLDGSEPRCVTNTVPLLRLHFLIMLTFFRQTRPLQEIELLMIRTNCHDGAAVSRDVSTPHSSGSCSWYVAGAAHHACVFMQVSQFIFSCRLRLATSPKKVNSSSWVPKMV